MDEAEVRAVDAAARNAEPPRHISHRCQKGGARTPRCATLLERPVYAAPCEGPECWPLPQGNGRVCKLCDGPSQLCINHRWANPEVDLCRDCILETRPSRVIEISGALETSAYRVVLSLSAKNPLNGASLRASRDSTLPYHDEIVKACSDWLMMLVADIYDQGQEDERRLNLQGQYGTREQYFTPGVSDDVAKAEWALAGRRTFTVALVIPSIGTAQVFAEHQTSLAAQSLTAFLASGTLASFVSPSPCLAINSWRPGSD